MGCGSSVPVGPAKQEEWAGQPGGAKDKKAATIPADDAPRGEIKAGTDAEAVKAKSKSTRARRLSYSMGAEEEGAAEAAGPRPPRSADESAGNRSARQASSNTRARRLSYVANDPAAQQQLEALGDEVAPELQEAAAPAAVVSAAGGGGGSGITCSMACMSRAGREPGYKKQNQDNCFAFEKYIRDDQALFGAFDGHGPNGHLVSGYVKQHLPIALVNYLTSEEDAGKALSKGFLDVDSQLAKSRIDCEFSGSTAAVAFLRGRLLTTAWVGDSRGVMGRQAKKGGALEAVALTRDHKPTQPEEKARILAANGRVERLVDDAGEPIGPFRVWLQFAWIPGLAMSRALGDALAHTVGVVSEPDCTVMELTPADKFIILASDGVWEFINSQEAVDIIGKYETVEEGCRQLVDEAYQRWLVEEDGVVDDITAVVVRFNYTD